MIEIQERDRRMLEAIADHRFLLGSHVARYFYPGVADRRVRERLQEIERAGLIGRESHLLVRRERIIRLTRRGESWVASMRSPELRSTKRFDPRTLEHDALVASVRFRLQEHWEASWIPESLLKQESFPQIPDGLLVFSGGHQVAVEVERTPKGPERFRQIQERWRGVPVKLVLYVATHSAMFATLCRYLETGPKDLPMGVISWPELERGTPKIWSVAGELDLLARRRLLG